MNKSLHDGHRERLRKKFLTNGIESFAEHEIIEMLLFYVIPRKNTNELAHVLLNQFGSISNILETPFNSLKSVQGLGENGACFIKFILNLIRIYSEEKENMPKNNSVTRKNLAKILSKKFLGRTDEIIAIMLIDAKKQILHTCIINQGSFNKVELNIRKIIELVVVFNAVGILIAHNHPSGVAIPSREDIQTTQKLQSIFNTMNIEFIDHIIVADSDYISLKDCNIDGLFGN